MLTLSDTVRGNLRDEDVLGPDGLNQSGDSDRLLRPWLPEAALHAIGIRSLVGASTSVGRYPLCVLAPQ